jgi:hypothetical protein
MTKSTQLGPEANRPSGPAAARLASLLGLLCLALASPPPALPQDAAGSYPNMAPIAQYQYPDRAAEIAAARSAAPAPIADKATVLALGRTGYETAVQGSNGFVCFVQRSWARDFDQPQFWNPKLRMPQCWNAVAAGSSLLSDYLKRTEWVLAGVSKDEMSARTKAKVVAHEIEAAPGSMAYMLSKDQLISDPTPGAPVHWYPHVMFFVPATDGSSWGANVPGAQVFSATSTVAPVTTYFLVVPRWSDGTLGPYVTQSSKRGEHHHG